MFVVGRKGVKEVAETHLSERIYLVNGPVAGNVNIGKPVVQTERGPFTLFLRRPLTVVISGADHRGRLVNSHPEAHVAFQSGDDKTSVAVKISGEILAF